MANIFDLSCNQKTFDDLQEVKARLKKEEDDEKERILQQYKEEHKKVYIFNTYEEAIDFMVAHPNKYIEWHGWMLEYDEKKKTFISLEDHCDYDGLNFWHESHEYDREQLIQDVKKIFAKIESKYPEMKGTKHWLDEYGKLDHVRIFDWINYEQ